MKEITREPWYAVHIPSLENNSIRVRKPAIGVGLEIGYAESFNRIAYLIAAAPDLFEALHSISFDAVFSVDEATVPKAGIDSAPDQVVFNASISWSKLKKARAAIAKARGES